MSLPLAAGLAPRKNLAKLRGERAGHYLTLANLGPVIERAIELAGWTNERAGLEMGYDDGSYVSRWIAGTEAPQFVRLWACLPLRSHLLVAMAERADADECPETDEIQIETTVKIRARRTA